jgi:hypothetical protein
MILQPIREEAAGRANVRLAHLRELPATFKIGRRGAAQ